MNSNALVFIAISAFAFWNLYNGFRTGKIYLGYMTPTRSDDPLYFWISVCFSCFLAFGGLYYAAIGIFHFLGG